MPVSVITTLKNEEKAIGPFLEGLLAQSRKPDEIVIVDGGSSDRSREKIEEFVEKGAPVKVILLPGNRAVGRNAAIRNAQYELIASSDVGSIPDANWLENIIEPLENDSEADVVSGITLPSASSLFEHCVAVINLPEATDIDPENFLPSSRSMAFRKSAWKKAGGYPERFSWNEDTLFNFVLKKTGAKFRFALEAVVYWRPPASLPHLFRQFFYYARGDGQAGIYFKEFYLPKKYLLYALGLVFLLLSIWFSWLLVVLLLGVILYFAKPLLKALRRTGNWKVLALMPVVILTRDFSEMTGYLLGLADRWHDPSYFKRP